MRCWPACTLPLFRPSSAEKPKRARKVKDFELFDKPLPFRIVGALANLDKGFEIVKDGYRTNRKYIPNTLMPAHFNDKAAKQQFDDVLRAIGGVFSDNLWRFDYDPTEVIGGDCLQRLYS